MLTEDDIKKVMNDVLDQRHDDLHVKAEKHYQDHQQLDQCRESKEEWQANHRFISDIRKNGDMIKGVIWTTFTRSTVVAILGLAAYIAVAFWQGRITPPTP